MTYAESNFAGSAIASNNQAAFTFSYLDVSEIRVDITVGSTTTTYSTSSSPAGFTVVSPNQFVTLSSHPADTDAIRIYRVTNLDTTQATFVSGSAISANDLNNNYKQTLQAAQETRLEASQATSTADTAKTTADAATVTAGNAVTTANSAVTSANAAVATANTADTNASAAVATANTASTNATNAVNTANSASTNASNAVTTANSAATDATTAINTANTATTTANGAVTTANAATAAANAAQADANTATTTANNATTTANSATSTANTANTNASNAVSTANSASATATAAANAVANAAFYSPIAAVANIPASPSNEDRIEIANSTGIQSFSPLTGVPSGFVGSTDLTVRLEYDSANSTWTWKQYFAADPENRYATNYLAVIKGDGTSSGQVGKITLNCSNNNHGVALQSPPHSAGATYTLTLPTALPTVAGQSLTSDTSGNLGFTTVDAAFVETPQTISTSKVIGANINAGMMGPTVSIASGVTITVGQNSQLTVLS